MGNVLAREEFLAERSTGIGGSDIHHIYSLEPYGCARRLAYEKTGATPEFDVDSKAMARGRALEHIVAEMYSLATGRSVHVHQHAVRAVDAEHLLVHVDRFISDPARPNDGVLEIKTAAREEYFRVKREGIRDGYNLQLQYAMGVTNATWGAFAVLWPDGWELLKWDLERDEDIVQMVLEDADMFWQSIQTGTMPPRLDQDDERCRKCPYLMECQGGVPTDSASVADETLVPLVQQYVEAQVVLQEAKADFDAVKDDLAIRMGQRERVSTSLGSISYSARRYWEEKSLEAELVAKYKTKIDWTAFATDHPELEAAHKKPGPKRSLRVYPKKKER